MVPYIKDHFIQTSPDCPETKKSGNKNNIKKEIKL
jgi:hypothetical protein